ncbi:MAG: FkbM family methyltransferase [Actinomycetota bacterium]
MPSLYARMARTVIHALPLYNGKGRIIDRTPLARLSFDTDTLDVQCAEGFTLRVWPNDLIGRHLYLTGRFDRCVTEVLVKDAASGACLWDIGANIGSIGCAFLASVPNSHVVAFEPLADIAALCRHNLAQFEPSRVDLIEAAVSDRVGVGAMNRVSGNTGRSYVVNPPEVGSENGVRLVDASALAGLPWPDVVKIDVEGHEVAVLRGLRPILELARPAQVVFEHHQDGRAVDPELLEIFESLGYDVLRIGGKWHGFVLAPYDRPRPGYEPCADFVAQLRTP